MNRRSILLLAAAAAAFGTPLRAQEPDLSPAWAPQPEIITHPGSRGDEGAAPDAPPPLITIGSPEEDRLRLMQILGKASTDGFLIRTPSTILPRRAAGEGLEWAVVRPEILTTWNSEIPFSLNDGALWAGRGAGARAMVGFRGRYGRVSLTVAPEFVYQQNLDFDFIPYPLDDRSRFASPWHTSPESMDLPLRFGDEPEHRLTLGQSSLSVEAGPVLAGASAENQWWGPGIRNAIVMSNNAAGIPHLFVRTASPIRTRPGDFEARWILGWLRESDHFDFRSANDVRSLSAAVVTFRPRFEPDLTVGAARSVFAPSKGLGVLLHAFDFVTDVGRPNERPVSDRRRPRGPDEVFSLFARWILPADGAEVYAEWARRERPASLRDFLVSPHHSQGYTLGFQWAREVRGTSLVRVQAEATNLEQSATGPERRVVGFYKSRPVPQGYTHLGEVVGASIGSGASSQWIAGDYLAPRWSVGLFGGRIRWENDTHYLVRTNPLPLGHDVSLFGGIRAGFRFLGTDIFAELAMTERYNYLFQYDSRSFGDIRALDVRNHTLRIFVSPAVAIP